MLPPLANAIDRVILRVSGFARAYKRGGLADLSAINQIINQPAQLDRFGFPRVTGSY